MTAALLLCGNNPSSFLRSDEPEEIALLQRGLDRAHELRQQEREDLARLIARELTAAMPKAK